MLMLSQDGSLDIDKLQIDISSGATTLSHSSYRVPEEATLPTTFAIVSNGKEQGTATISVVGWRGSTALDRRDAIVTQIPTDRVAALRIVLSGRCSQFVTSRVGADGAVAESGCGMDETCDPALGVCAGASVDATSLPSYAEGDESLTPSLGGEPPADVPESPLGSAGGVSGGGASAVTSPGDAGATAVAAGGRTEGGAAEGGAAEAGAGGSTTVEPCAGGCAAPNPVCLAGTCVPCAPDPIPRSCRNGFPQYCDTSGHLANVDSGKCSSTETCENGACVCNGLKCGGVCRDPETDAANCGSCGHTCVVGSCASGRCTVVPIASGVDEPTHVVVGGGWLYWLASGAGKIYQMPLSTGQAKEMVVQGSSTVGNCDGSLTALWANDSWLYWTAQYVCQRRHGANSDSSQSGTSRGMWSAGGSSNRLGALTGFGNNVFNVNLFDAQVQSSDGSGFPFQPTSVQGQIAADAQNLYWFGGKSQGAISIYEHTAPALDSTAVELVKGQSSGEGIAAYDGFVYWTAAPTSVAGAGSIMRVSATPGGMVTTVASGQTNPSGLAVDSSGVYWTNRYANGAIMRAPHAGGTVVELATGQNGAHGIALDANAVYWTNTEGGEIQMVSK